MNGLMQFLLLLLLLEWGVMLLFSLVLDWILVFLSGMENHADETVAVVAVVAVGAAGATISSSMF